MKQECSCAHENLPGYQRLESAIGRANVSPHTLGDRSIFDGARLGDSGEFSLVNSAVLIFEHDANPFPERQKNVQDYLSLASVMVNMIPAMRDRGRMLESLGFKPIDALHVAAAEQGQAEVLVTCDDALLKTARRHAGILQVKVMSVLRFIAEEI
jgi:hypothetical protein